MIEPTKDDLLIPVLNKLVETVERVEKFIDSRFKLLQSQMSMMEQQLNVTTIWASRSYNSNLDPEARATAMEEAKKSAEELAKQMQEEEEALLKERAARGIGDGGDAVTEADIEWFKDDSDR